MEGTPTEMKQRTLGLCMLGAAGVSSLITWFASVQIRSPAEVAARTAPPEPSQILVPVEERELATKIVSRGTGRYGSPRDISVTRSRLKDGRQIITGLPRTGQILSQGAVAFTISGRPTFLLDGSLPSYRDLGPGMSGADVRQLERALQRIGLSPGRVDGRYDAATGHAVSALYRRRGFQPIVASQAQLNAVRPREARFIPGASSSGGVQLPSDEVIFVPRSPLRVTKVGTRLGATPSGSLITVTNSVVSVDGSLPVDQAGLVKPGTKVLIDEPALGIKATGRVARVADRPGTDGVDGFHVFFEVVVDNPPPALVGTSVRLTVPVKSTGKAQMVVPISAVTLGPDGGSRVQRAADGKTEFITVEPGLAADGYVAIKAPYGGLAPGDQVVVGFEMNGGGAP
jgi:peptidoglycan hydrolase-like protein with peptidoglycan-binding domain